MKKTTDNNKWFRNRVLLRGYAFLLIAVIGLSVILNPIEVEAKIPFVVEEETNEVEASEIPPEIESEIAEEIRRANEKSECKHEHTRKEVVSEPTSDRVLKELFVKIAVRF